MRNNTQKIFEKLIRGAFISVDSSDIEIKHLYNDIEENFTDYEIYFQELGLRLDAGNGYYYFSRDNENKITMEQKLQSFSRWIDILDFLKTYDITFSAGFQFRMTHILERINLDIELRDKAHKLFHKQITNREVIEKLVSELTAMGFAEIINEQDQTYKVTSAFRYTEEMVNIITIYNEDEIPEL